jgi:hypothetical protein
MQQRAALKIFILVAIAGGSSLLQAAEPAVLTVVNVKAPVGKIAQVDVTVTDGATVGALDLALSFDPAVIRYHAIEPGPVARSALLEANEIAPGRLLVALAASDGLADEGSLLRITFQVVGSEGDQSPIIVEAANAYHHEELIDLPLTTIDGEMSIVAARLPVSYLAAGAVMVLVLVLILLARRRRTASR